MNKCALLVRCLCCAVLAGSPALPRRRTSPFHSRPAFESASAHERRATLSQNAVLCPLLLATRFSIIIVAIPAAPYHTWRPTTALSSATLLSLPRLRTTTHVFTGGPYDLVRHAGPPEPRNVACRVKRSLSKLQCITTIKRMRLRVVSCSEFGASERAPVQAERSSWAGSQWAGSSRAATLGAVLSDERIACGAYYLYYSSPAYSCPLGATALAEPLNSKRRRELRHAASDVAVAAAAAERFNERLAVASPSAFRQTRRQTRQH